MVIHSHVYQTRYWYCTDIVPYEQMFLQLAITASHKDKIMLIHSSRGHLAYHDYDIIPIHPTIPLYRLAFFSLFHCANDLYTRRIEHNSNLSTDRLWGKIPGESASYNTVASVSTAHLTPIDTVLGSALSSVY